MRWRSRLARAGGRQASPPCTARVGGVGEFIRIVPDLVVEILSPSTSSRDRGEKKAIYERNGVRELWLVDPRARRIVRFVLAEGRFDLGTVFDQDDRITSTVLGGLHVPVAPLVAID